MLARHGFTVTVAGDGKEALEILGTRNFDIILMDIRMPVMDGIETVRRIRADPTLRSQKVIALSAGVLEEEVELAMNAGFDHYLTKPIDFEALQRVLHAESSRSSTQPDINQAHQIRGVNFGKALESHSGDMEFLVQLTHDFKEIYGDAGEVLQSHIDRQNLEEAERLAHNIAGIAGSFGANALMEAARAAEAELKNTQACSEAAVAAFSAELANFVLAINDFQQLEPPQISASGS